MTSFKVTPIWAAIMLLTAATPALAQSAAGTPAQTQGGTTGDPLATPVQTVEVVGIRKSIRSAEEIKRDSLQVVDSINADDIGKFPDRAAGDALQRIAGVQVGRDRGETGEVIIRGLPDVATSIDGNEIFTGTGRRLAYQDLPVQSIAGLDVYKSATANQFEGGIAGAVNIRLRAPFDFKGSSFTGYVEERRSRTEGSSASKAKNNPGGGFTASNRWNSGVGEMGVLFDVAYNKDHWGYPVQWNDRPDRIFSVSPDGTATRLQDNQPVAPLRAGDRLGNLSHVGGIYNAGDRDRSSVHGAFQWKINPKLELTTQYLHTGYRGRSEVDYIFSIAGWAPTLTNVVLAPEGSYCRTPEGTICPIVSAVAPAAQFGGPYDWDPFTATSTWGVKEKTDTDYLNFQLQFRDGPWNVVSSAAVTRSKFVNDTVIVDQQIPNSSSNIYTYGADGHGGFNAITTPTSASPLTDPRQFVLRGMVQNWRESEGEQAQWRTDVSYRMQAGIINGLTGGVRLSTRQATFHGAEGHSDVRGAVRPNPVDVFGADFEKLVPGIDRLGGPFVTPSRDFLIDQADRVRQFYGATAGRVADDPTRLFDQRERTATAYLSARWRTAVGDIDISGSAGARLVRVNRTLRGKNRIGDTITDVDLKTSETNVLPNLSAVVNWTNQLQSHLSVGKTITRPEFASLNPALSLIPPTVNAPGTGSAGNPNLEPTKSLNTDATLEYYFPKNGYVQVALFDRDIKGYLQSFEQAEVIDGLNYRVHRPQNSGKGSLRGAEFGIQKFFDFLPGAWSGFGAQFNYTWITGENQTRTSLNSNAFKTTPLVGVAKKSYNFALLYERMGITGRLAATHRGDYVEQIAEPRFAQNRYVKATTYVDLSLGYDLTKNVAVQFDAINLTKAKYESYLEDPMRPRDIRYTPTAFGLSLRVKL